MTLKSIFLTGLLYLGLIGPQQLHSQDITKLREQNVGKQSYAEHDVSGNMTLRASFQKESTIIYHFEYDQQGRETERNITCYDLSGNIKDRTITTTTLTPTLETVVSKSYSGDSNTPYFSDSTLYFYTRGNDYYDKKVTYTKRGKEEYIQEK